MSDRCFGCGRPMVDAFGVIGGRPERWLVCTRWLAWWPEWFEYDHEGRFVETVEVVPPGARTFPERKVVVSLP